MCVLFLLATELSDSCKADMICHSDYVLLLQPRVKLTLERKHKKENLNRQDVVAIQGKELKKKYDTEA